MKISISGGEAFTLTSQTIDKLIRAGDGDAALLYLYILRTRGRSTDEQAAAALRKGKGWVASATALLSRLGLIEVDAGLDNAVTAEVPAPIDEAPGHTQEEVIDAINSGSDFTVVVEETKRRLGKALTADEMLRLYGIYETLRMPPEVILLLITHCISECRLHGDGRAPSVKYIEKAAYTWEREGIFTIERAEEYLKALETKKSAQGKIKQILQIRDREFSETEKHYVDGWLKMGFELDAIELAYDKTIINTGKLAFPYMDTILKKWDAKGIHTAKQAQEKDKRGGSGGTQGDDRSGQSAPAYSARTGRGQAQGQKHGEPSRDEIERMRRLREKMKKD